VREVRRILPDAFNDADASVWVASSDDVPGLVTESDTMELLVARLKVLIPELLEAMVSCRRPTIAYRSTFILK